MLFDLNGDPDGVELRRLQAAFFAPRTELGYRMAAARWPVHWVITPLAYRRYAARVRE